MKDSKEYSCMVTFYHDVEKDFDCEADPKVCLDVICEFLRIEKKYDIMVTYNIVGKLFEKQPELIKKITEAGHEVAFHSYTHDPSRNPQIFSDEIIKCREVSATPVGYCSPGSEWNNTTLKALWKNGFLWNAEGDKNSEPYFIHKGLVRLPIAFDDSPVHIGEITLEEWIRKFSFFLRSRIYFGYGTHDGVFSFDPQRYLDAYESVIKLAIENDTLIVSFSQAADLFRRSALANYYSSIANCWNNGTKALYRSKRFQELIRNEVIKLKATIVADLGSGGGALSNQLKDIVSKIYCVDNSPGMINDLETDNVVQSILGEITESTLPEDTVDFIIFARILEYIYYPDHVANEIKRIGKIGSKFFVTVPAYINDGPRNEGVAPDKIRKHYTREEVLIWANQIGPGKLIGIQYYEAEPKDINEEDEYRKIEQEQPANLTPTNWVFIGTIENKDFSPINYKNIPLNTFKFSFTNETKIKD